jgi:hypothetical protein
MFKDKNNDVKYVTYTRSLNDDGSIGAQLAELHSLAKEERLKIVAELSDIGGAKVPYQREGFGEMIKIFMSGKANGILCTTMDRLALNPVEEATIQWLLQGGKIENVKSLDRSWYSNDSAVMTAIEFGIATQYCKDLKEKTNDSKG